MRPLATLIFTGLVLGLCSCAGPTSAPSSGTETPVAPVRLSLLPSAAAAEGAGDWGTIKGQVIFGGDAVPEAKKLDITKDQEHCLGKGPILSEDWVVNPNNKGVKWAFVWLTPADPKAKTKLPVHPELAKPKGDGPTLDQPTCQFVPHAIAMRQGETLTVLNSAKIAHNVHWTGHPLKNPGGNVIVPAGGKHVVADLVGDRLPVKVVCDIHGWMSAWIRIFDHPYYALTNADGKFEIKNAPAGEYRLVVWHESAGWGGDGRDGKAITIKGGVDNDLGTFTVKPSN